MSDGSARQAVFSYGSLQRSDVQLDTFGRVVDGEEDALPGHRLEWSDVDHHAVRIPGTHAHPVLRVTGDPHDRVFGRVLELSAAELEAADEYEVALYRRVSVLLASGRRAWVYVSA